MYRESNGINVLEMLQHMMQKLSQWRMRSKWWCSSYDLRDMCTH